MTNGMKKLLLFLVSLTAGLAAGYGAARWSAIDFLTVRLHAPSPKCTCAAFRPTEYALENLPFTIVIVGRNNGAYLERTLESAFSQNYEHFRIVYIDDASDDGSFELARDLIYNSPRFSQIHLVRNERPSGILANLAAAVRGCSDEEIIVVLNGEDWLAHEWVLQRLNQYYADPDLWLTYGQCRDYPTFQIGGARAYAQDGKGIRTQPFSVSHLKTFYAGLFKKINDSDLLHKGEYIQAAADVAYMLPMLEMAEEHFQCLSDILYISNRESPREDRETQAFFERHIRALKPYERLMALALKPTGEAAQ